MIVNELNSLIQDQVVDIEHDCTAAEVAGAVCRLLSEVILKDDDQDEKMGDWLQGISELRCKIIGEHVWYYDQCGYWGHQYCGGCQRSKYPELAKLRCSEAIEKIGRIKEVDYIGERIKS